MALGSSLEIRVSVIEPSEGYSDHVVGRVGGPFFWCANTGILGCTAEKLLLLVLGRKYDAMPAAHLPRPRFFGVVSDRNNGGERL